MSKLGAIILAAGKGTRMKSKKTNKVTLVLGNEPMILHTVHLVRSLKINSIVVVVGFAKESVKQIIKENVIFAEQRKRLGTAHAAGKGLMVLPRDITDVLVLYGDDSAFYKKETIDKLIENHFKEGNVLTFLTTLVSNPTGLGRIIRQKNGKLLAIVEEKNATEDQKKIKEINPACYIFNVGFLNKYLKKIKKDPVKGEYYLTDMVDIAISNNEKINAYNTGPIHWRGVNTYEEFEEANKLYLDRDSSFASS